MHGLSLTPPPKTPHTQPPRPTNRQAAERVRSLRPTVARRKFLLDDRRRALRGAVERLEAMEGARAGRALALREGLRWYLGQVGCV